MSATYFCRSGIEGSSALAETPERQPTHSAWTWDTSGVLYLSWPSLSPRLRIEAMTSPRGDFHQQLETSPDSPTLVPAFPGPS